LNGKAEWFLSVVSRAAINTINRIAAMAERMNDPSLHGSA
jgi:hypothetical protein